MLRSPVPLLFLILIAIAVVNPAEVLPKETISSPEVQLQQVPRSTSSVPNDTVTWTEFRWVLTVIGATIVLLFLIVLGALCVDLDRESELNRLRYASILFFGYFGIFALFGVVDRQSIWSTVGGSVILCSIGLLSMVFWRRAWLLIPEYMAIVYLNAFFGYVALLCVGIASYLGAACLNGYDWFIFGGAFLCFVELLAILVLQPRSRSLDIVALLYGHVLIVYIGIVGNLSLVRVGGNLSLMVPFGGMLPVFCAVIFVLFCLLILFYRPRY
uniref:Uncharacterized protein n=1 Tax=Globodera rostochiensis TaxID=31243 RepID=A0A914HE25_GLORO